MKRHVLCGLLLLFTTIFFVSFSPVPTFAYSYYDEDENTDGTEADDEDDTEDDTESIANDEDDENIANDEDDEDEGFTVYFNENGGDITSSFNTIQVTTGAPYGELPTVSRSGFSFQGWYTKEKGGTKITAETICTLTDDATLHAHWKSTGGYTITYILDGGVNNSANPDEFKKKSKTITLKDPSRTDFTFGGWFTDKKYTKPVTSIKKGTTKNITLYAKWLDNPRISKASSSKNKVLLTWVKCDGALKYKIYQSTSPNGKFRACATVTGTKATIPNLAYKKNYYFRISAVYKVSGKIVTTEASPLVSAYCTKTSSGSNSSPSKTPQGNVANVSSGMPYYYQLDGWKFSYNERLVSCFCCAPAMVLHAMGYDCDPNKLYDVMGGVAFNSAKIEKKYGVKVTRYTLTGKSEAARKQELYNYLASRPQGVLIRQDGYHTEVAYLKDGVIKVNDSGIRNGECIDLSRSLIKKYTNIHYVYTIDKK